MIRMLLAGWAVFTQALRQLGPVPPAVTDEHCPYCMGLGHDSSGFTCERVMRKQRPPRSTPKVDAPTASQQSVCWTARGLGTLSAA